MTDYTIEELQQEEPCQRCGKCCTGHILIITEQEWNTIAEALDRTPLGLALTTRAVPIPTDNPIEYRMTLYPCPFLEKTNQCIIYAIRPQKCREWPYQKAINQIKNGEQPTLHSKCKSLNKWKKRMREVKT